MSNLLYKKLLQDILTNGDIVNTRNHETYSNIFTNSVILDKFPLVTVRKTAWKKAIKEMEWFLSGKENCPKELNDWWKGQLSKDNCLLYGYSKQFRYFSDPSNPLYRGKYYSTFDQIQFILNSLKSNPYSRRLILTSWHSGEMSRITKHNDNPNTPTTCHNTCTQFFVRNKTLHIKTYQRSADMLLGVPHNWVQTWAMLLYFAHHSNLFPGKIIWEFGDAHIYKENTHLEVANFIINSNVNDFTGDLIYEPKNIEMDDKNVPIFKSEDFYVNDNIPEPLITIRPTLL